MTKGLAYLNKSQYKDKTGVLIKAGDILSSGEIDNPRICEVYYDGEDFRVKYPPHDYDEPLWVFMSYNTPFKKTRARTHVEIIGRIPDDKELLKLRSTHA